jgi:hypothetical protein
MAVLGAGLGWGMSADLDWSAAASQHECAQASGLCFGLAPFVGLLAGVVVGVSACWLSLAAVRLQPVGITIPAAIAVLPVTAFIYLARVPGGRLHPPWLFALVTGAVFALLAVTTITMSKQNPWRAHRKHLP